MTINEFRAWLDGFREAVGEAPPPVWCGPSRSATSALPGVLTALAANQTRLGPEFEAVWSENIDALYQN